MSAPKVTVVVSSSVWGVRPETLPPGALPPPAPRHTHTVYKLRNKYVGLMGVGRECFQDSDLYARLQRGGFYVEFLT